MGTLTLRIEMFMTSHISSCLYNGSIADLCLFCRGRYLISPPYPPYSTHPPYSSYNLIFLPPTIYRMNSLQFSSHIPTSNPLTSESF